MAVALDTQSAPPGASGNHGHIASIDIFQTDSTQATFQNVGASATFLLVYVCSAQTSANTGTWTVVWDDGGTNQTMTQIGSGVFSNNGTGANGVFLFGLVNPTSGNKTIGIKNSSSAFAGGQLTYVGGISFTGSATASVAAATEGNATNDDNGTPGTQGSVTSAVSIPATDMAVAVYNVDGAGTSMADPKTPNDGGTLADTDGALSTGCSSGFYTGAGSAIASQWDISGGSDHWAAAIVGIKVPAAGGDTLGGMNQLVMMSRRRPDPVKRLLLPSRYRRRTRGFALAA